MKEAMSETEAGTLSFGYFHFNFIFVR